MSIVVLYFDPSEHGAGALLERDGMVYRLHQVRDVHFGTAAGDVSLMGLFANARELGAGVACEEPLGYDQRGHIIRAAQNRRIGLLQEYTRQSGLRWLGTVAPATAKLALTGNGRADKSLMIRMANIRYVQPYLAACRCGDRQPVCAVLVDPTGEHMADALGGCQAACEGRFVVKRGKKRGTSAR